MTAGTGSAGLGETIRRLLLGLRAATSSSASELRRGDLAGRFKYLEGAAVSAGTRGMAFPHVPGAGSELTGGAEVDAEAESTIGRMGDLCASRSGSSTFSGDSARSGAADKSACSRGGELGGGDPANEGVSEARRNRGSACDMVPCAAPADGVELIDPIAEVGGGIVTGGLGGRIMDGAVTCSARSVGGGTASRGRSGAGLHHDPAGAAGWIVVGT